MVLNGYLFSFISGDYQQYITDQSESFLKYLCKNCSAPNQIAIHRDGNLMYYAYAHKNSESEIFGICIVCGEVCLDIKMLYYRFQKMIEDSAEKGILFHYDEQGNIRKRIQDFSSEPAEVALLISEIKNFVSDCRDYWEELPAEDFSVPLDAKIRFSFNEDDNMKIVGAIRHYHNVIITENIVNLSSSAQTIIRLDIEKRQLQDEKASLQKEIAKLKSQKKQYRKLGILVFVVIICLVGLFIMNNIIDDTRKELSDAKEEIEDLEIRIDNATSKMNSAISKQEEIQKEFTDFRNLVAAAIPIIISDIKMGNGFMNGDVETMYGETIYSHKTMFLMPQINYTGINIGKDITVKIKLFSPDGKLSMSMKEGSPTDYSYQTSMYVSKGSGKTTLSGWGGEDRGHWKSGNYRIEIWYEDICLKTKSFKIL